jgi:Mn-dependent DtxR family transcriptional regulator
MRRMERPDRTTEQWVTLVKSRQIYKTGEKFSKGNMASAMDCSPERASQILNHMADRALVIVIPDKRGAQTLYWYRKSKPSFDPIRVAWRRHPNFHPMPSRWQLGAPI